MSNPFESALASDFIATGVSYRKFIHDQIKNIEIGDSVKIDIGVKDIVSARMNINQASLMMAKKFKTKVSEDKELWVFRVH